MKVYNYKICYIIYIKKKRKKEKKYKIEFHKGLINLNF